jgi:V8-like Glu-specific endopeptidase
MKALAITLRTGAVALALAAAPALALGTPATAAQPPAPAAASTGTVGGTATVSAEAWAAGRAAHGPDVTAAEAVAAYWTPERMRAAKPIEDSTRYADAARAFERRVQDRQADTRGTERSFPPAAGALGAPAAVPAALNPNFASNHPTARTSGKVFFQMSGGTFQCSGTVINSEGQDTVWTAGHCVHGGAGGAWATNWQFVPAFDDDLGNPRPFGTWTAIQLFSRTAWVNNSNFGEDMGVAIMGTLNGNHIVTQLGGQGLRVNQSRTTTENAFGYPAEAPFDGGNLMRCAGTTAPESPGATETLRMPCDMTRGSSGGGWLNGWDGNFGFLNGINSRIDRIVNPTIMLSPYFDDTALSLYNDTRNL